MSIKRKRYRRYTSAQEADNERWERIYYERFADPYYYAAIQPARGSSLGEAIRPGRSDRRTSVTERAE